MSTDLDDVLQRVAAGELAPEEALALLDPSPGPTPPTEPSDAPPAGGRFFGYDPSAGATDAPPLDDEPASFAVEEVWAPPLPGTGIPAADDLVPGAPIVRLRTSYRRIHVVADPAIAEVFVTGAHALHRDGAAFVIENPGDVTGADASPDDPSFSARYRFTAVPWGLARPATWKDERLVVRVNPHAFVDVEMAGGHLGLSGFWGGLRLRVAASAVRLGNVRGAFDIDALTSSIKGMCSPTGASKIDLESSSCKVQLLPGSNLRIQARNRMGKVVLPTSVSKGGLADPDLSEAVLGTGQDSLVIDALMSSVSVTS